MATCSNPRKIVPKTVTNSVQSSIHCKWSFCIFSLVHTKDPSLKFKSFPFPTMIMNDVKGETWCEGLEPGSGIAVIWLDRMKNSSRMLG